MTTGTVLKRGRHGKVIAHIKDFAPRYIVCYVSKKDLSNGIPDAWTVVFTKANCWQLPKDAPKWLKAAYIAKVWYIGMTRNGAYYHGVANRTRFYAGTQIAFKDLSKTQRRTVIEEYEACWRIKMKVNSEYFPVDWEEAWE